MLTLFRTNQQFVNFFILLYLLLLRGGAFFMPQNIPSGTYMNSVKGGLFSQWVLSSIPLNGFTSHLIALLLLFLQGVLINLMAARYRITTETTLFPGLFYCLIASILPDFIHLSPILMANTFLVLALYYLFGVYRNNNSSDAIFDVGLWLGVASLFDFSYIIFLLWGIIGLSSLRGFKPQEFLMFLIGCLVPYILAATYLFWYDNLGVLAHHFRDSINLSFNITLLIQNSNTIIQTVGIGLLLLFVLANSGRFFSRKNVSSQKYISIFYWLLLLTILAFFLQSPIGIQQLLIFAVPLGVLLALSFQLIDRSNAEALHMLILIVALLGQYHTLILK